MEVEKQYELIAKLLSENISEDEKAMLDQWLSESRDNADILEKAKQAWTLSGNQTIAADTDLAWNKLKAKLVEEKIEVKRTSPMYWISRVAAAVILLIGIGFILNNYLNRVPLQTVASGDSTMNIHLPDGSTVWLNRNSELTYAVKFTGKKRTVSLKGEAFFEVQHDSLHPFVISAEKTTTTVLGTSFDVRALTNEATVEVTVATGRVSFADAKGDKKTYLLPGDKGVFEKGSHALATVRNADHNFLAWKTHKLVFENNTLNEVAAVMSKYYGIEFKIPDKATAAILFTGTFDEAGINDAIKIVETSTATSISKQQNGYIISAN